MNKIPLHLFKRPALWQRTDSRFWDDEHISKGMLQAHLDPALDAASRRLETIERSVAWLSRVIPAKASVLDLGCGPGLYDKRLSAMGYRVTGMDLSCRSIAYAKEYDPATAYVCQSYLEMDYHDAFDAILLIYCDYAALTAPEREALLARVYAALKPGGLFLLDVFTDVHFRRKSEHTSWHMAEGGGFWSAETHLCLNATYLYENNRIAADQTIVLTADKAVEYIIWDTAYSRQSLTNELLSAGLKPGEFYADVCGSPYSEESETLCCIARRQAL